MLTATRTRVAAVLVLVLASAACSKKDKPDPKPSELMSPLESYQSVKDVQGDLKIKGDAWEVIEDRKPLVSDTRPLFQTYTVALPTYFHRGVQGRLVLHFYNDRLMRTQFYPQDMDAYRSALEREDKLTFDDQQETFIDPATKVWVGKDDKGAKYVGWVDKNQKAEMDDWIKKYS